MRMGFFDTPAAGDVPALFGGIAEISSLSAEGLREPVAPEVHRSRILSAFTPLPSWYRPLEEGAAVDRGEFPLHAITQRPMAMYHSWGSMNSWLRQIHTANRMFVPGARVRRNTA